MGRSAHVAERLFQEGYHVYGLDYRGFGKSEGLRGYISDFDLLMDDVEHYVNVVLRSYPDDVKVFAFGQSLGGASALHLALRMPDILDGILMLAPAIKQNGDLQPLMQLLARVVGYLLPTLEITKLPAGLGCRNPASNEDFYDDPLNHKGYIHAGTGYALLQQCQYLQENMHTLKVPFLCLHGTLDKMVDPTGAHMLVEHAKHLRKEEKELKFYEGVWHDLIHDPEYEMVLDDCVQWMADRTEFSSN